MALDRPTRVIGFSLSLNIFFCREDGDSPGASRRRSPRRILMAKHATIRLKGLKVMQPIPAELVPVDLVPADGPAGNPSLTLELEGFGPVCTAVLNGKSYRRMLKALAERGAEGVTILLQGTLRPDPGGLPVLEGAGISAVPKSPAAPPDRTASEVPPA
jgi:hypothetical protein